MYTKCKNCGKDFKGNFCNTCGQSADTHPVNAHFLWHDIQHGLFHFDNGVFYSVKELYLRPGHSIREFIQGKRVKHFKPISLVVILATIYGLLYHFFEINLFEDAEKNGAELKFDINSWFEHHYAWFTLATIPIYTIGTYVSFKNVKYNYFELFILNSFKASQRLILHIVTLPLIYFFNNTPKIQMIMGILYGLDILLIYWTNIQFFSDMNKWKVLGLTILSHLIFVVLFSLVLSLIILAFGL